MARAYSKGARVERELLHFFSGNGFEVVRSAGSGVNSLSPDLLVFRHARQYAIECKAWEKPYLSFEKEKVAQMKRWEERTGITYLIAWKQNRKEWLFFPIHFLDEQEKSFTISLSKAKLIGQKLDDLV
ncbi:MAG: Holliday junction resolvase Hjc [Candidatus Micrarchaeota archaeon]|nr:Holliday junction resolvase Hjc [Candidatus Micrarchaeota archaeon]